MRRDAYPKTKEMKQEIPRKANTVLFRIIACLLILGIGIGGMRLLASFKKPPAEAVKEERPLRVDVSTVTAVSVPVVITGHGEARALDVVSIAAEVAGRLESVHDNAEVGGIIPAGAPLFSIDPRNYIAARDEAAATVRQMTEGINRLRQQEATDRQRLKSLERNRKLAGDEFARVKDLYERDQVGTRSGVDAMEQAYNNVADQADKLAQAVSLYPLQIAETRGGLAAAEARLALAATNLGRCTVRAPFTGRVKETSIEAGQYVAAGQPLITLANDAVLEIQVSLDSLDAQRWLNFTDDRQDPDIAWFHRLTPVICTISWTEDRASWQGLLHRVVRFDAENRTVTVAIRINAADARATTAGLPLVEGMYCQVEIPGRTLTGVYRLPRWAVSFANTVFLAVDGRLKTVPVQVAWSHGDEAFIDQGLARGDQVIVTRLVNPLENSLLTTRPYQGEAAP